MKGLMFMVGAGFALVGMVGDLAGAGGAVGITATGAALMAFAVGVKVWE